MHSAEPCQQWNVWRWAENYLDQAARISSIWWTRQQGAGAIAKARETRLQSLLHFSRQHSPFYQHAYRSLPEQGVALESLPVMHKPELMAHFDKWVTDSEVTLRTLEKFLEDPQRIGELYLGRYGVWKSSGSTGQPGIFVQDQNALATYDALLLIQLNRLEQAMHYAQGCSTRAGRSALVTATGNHFATIATWMRLARGHPWLDNRVFSITMPLQQLVEELNVYQPAFLSSYPTLLALLAQEQDAGRLRLHPSLLWSGGECLTESSHVCIEASFGCPLISEYGASECMSIAYGCPEGWLHVNTDWLILEPVDRNYQPVPAGELSDTVLLTNLANRVQPLLRYDLGDRILMNPEPCRCGSLLPAIHVEGRHDDVLWLKAKDGAKVAVLPMALTTIVEENSDLHHFQIVQTADDCLAIRAGHGRNDCAQVSKAAYFAVQSYLASLSLPNVRVVIDAQEPVLDRSGKLRQVITLQGAQLTVVENCISSLTPHQHRDR